MPDKQRNAWGMRFVCSLGAARPGPNACPGIRHYPEPIGSNIVLGMLVLVGPLVDWGKWGPDASILFSLPNSDCAK